MTFFLGSMPLMSFCKEISGCYEEIIYFGLKKVMGLSSGTLIHQTEYSSLKQIISGMSFKVSYSVEEFEYRNVISPKSYGGTSYIHVFPMISFSEIPINSLQYHLYRYGECVIGMKKDWGYVNRLNPVHYCSYQSNMAKSLIASYNFFNMGGYHKLDKEYFDEGVVNEQEIFNNTLQHLEYQMAHSKNYRGRVETKTYKDDDYFFSEEKEWRYVPLHTSDNTRLSLHIDSFLADKDSYQEKVGEEKLNFSLNDLSYIIVDNDLQKNEIIDLLSNKGDNVHINIFTNDEIKESFLGYKNQSINEYNLRTERDSLLEENKGNRLISKIRKFLNLRG
jgi:hypothetical protein